MIKWWLTVGKESVQVSNFSDNDMVLTVTIHWNASLLISLCQFFQLQWGKYVSSFSLFKKWVPEVKIISKPTTMDIEECSTLESIHLLIHSLFNKYLPKEQWLLIQGFIVLNYYSFQSCFRCCITHLQAFYSSPYSLLYGRNLHRAGKGKHLPWNCKLFLGRKSLCKSRHRAHPAWTSRSLTSYYLKNWVDITLNYFPWQDTKTLIFCHQKCIPLSSLLYAIF